MSIKSVLSLDTEQTQSSYDKRGYSAAALLDRAFKSLPVRLDGLEQVSKVNPLELFEHNTATRLIVSLLNEQDERISDTQTKQQIVRMLHNMATYSRKSKLLMRLVLMNVTDWCDEEYEHDDERHIVVMKEEEILNGIKGIFTVTWPIDSLSYASLCEDKAKSLREYQILISQHYATTLMQSIVRSFLSRKHLRQKLHDEAEAQRDEIKRWSVLIIQKIARGYITRKTILRSMHIRKQLSKDVLRIAERYLQHGDLWGFLKEINDELIRSDQDNAHNQQREDNWAENFVNKVVQQRQMQFNRSWDQFPNALRDFTGKETMVGTLLSSTQTEEAQQQKQLEFQERLRGESQSFAAGGRSLVGDGFSANAKSVTASSIFPSISTINPPSPMKQKKHRDGTTMQAMRSTSINDSTAPLLLKDVSFSSSHQVDSMTPTGTIIGSPSRKRFDESTVKTSKTLITADEVAVALRSQSKPGHQSVPGPLVRKALGNTVHAEVAKELNVLVNGEYRSRKLSEDIRSVYGPMSDTSHRTVRPPKHLQRSRSTNSSREGKKTGGTTKNTTVSLAPVKVKGSQPKKPLPLKKKKPKLDVNGKVIPDVGKIEATHGNWIQSSGAFDQVVQQQRGERELNGSGDNKVQPGEVLLLDVPLGLNDSLEKLLHAAGLRCYVPDFFQGVTAPKTENDASADVFDMDSVDDSVDEVEVAARLRESRRLAAQNKNINSDADYAYQMYLKMPLGLAKVRYEQLCKKWAQGPINRLRAKGLTFISDVVPVSKFIVCLKSVDTPRTLINKTIELYLELKAMGTVPLGAPEDVSAEAIQHRLRERAIEQQQFIENVSLDTNRHDITDTLVNRMKKIDLEKSKRQQLKSNKEETLKLRTLPPPSFESSSSIDDAGNIHKTLTFGSFADLDDESDHEGRIDDTEEKNDITTNVETTYGTDGDEDDDEEEHGDHIAPLPTGQHDAYEGMTLQAKLKAQRREAKRKAELPSKLLLSLVEDSNEAASSIGGGVSDWCDMRATVEDLFLHAAYLIVPHTDHSSVEESLTKKDTDIDHDTITKEVDDKESSEGVMGNAAFKRHIAFVLDLETEDAKREAVKERFRAAFIMATPFTLYLKSQGVFLVQDLLKVQLADLEMPKELETQVEVLLTAVVAKSVDAKIQPMPRDHLPPSRQQQKQGNYNLYTVPMYYDPKFQRSPLDPYGRPPRIQQKNSHKMVQVKLKARERRRQKQSKAEKNLNVVSSSSALEQDMHVPITLWGDIKSLQGRQSNEYGEFLDDMDDIDAAGVVVDDDQWQFAAIHHTDPIDHLPAQDDNNQQILDEQREQSSVQLDKDDGGTEKIEDHSKKIIIGSGQKQTKTKDSTSRKNNSESLSKSIEDQVFRTTFTCPHPGCEQVFAREYTYNIHLKTHKLFPQYHAYKRQPQLYVDADTKRSATEYEVSELQRTMLPPQIQQDLSSLINTVQR